METKALIVAKELLKEIRSLIPELQEWMKTRKDTVQQVNDVLTVLGRRLKTTKRAKLSGALMALGGSLLAAAGGVLTVAVPPAAEVGIPLAMTGGSYAVAGGTIFIGADILRAFAETLANADTREIIKKDSRRLKTITPYLNLVKEHAGTLEEICETFPAMYGLNKYFELGKSVSPSINQLYTQQKSEQNTEAPNPELLAQLLNCLKAVVSQVRSIQDLLEHAKGVAAIIPGLLSPGQVIATGAVGALVALIEVGNQAHSLSSKIKTVKENQLHELLEQLRDEQKYFEKLTEKLDETQVAVQEYLNAYERQALKKKLLMGIVVLMVIVVAYSAFGPQGLLVPVLVISVWYTMQLTGFDPSHKNMTSKEKDL